MPALLRIVIVEDSKIFQRFLREGLGADPHIEVVGVADDAFQARDMILQLKPDAITLDLGLPGFDGVDFLDRIMKYRPLPVVIVSASAGTDKGVQAMNSGAFDIFAKPTADTLEKQRMLEELREVLRLAVKYPPGTRRPGTQNASAQLNSAVNPSLIGVDDRIIIIGSSTGGPEALEHVLIPLPPNAPGVVIAQHMPGGFTASMAQTLNRKCSLKVKEARTGDQIVTGQVLVSPGGRQTVVVKKGGKFFVDCEGTKAIGGHRPSVNVLMNSAAEQIGKNAIGIMLTGMGEDGADGMLAMRQQGSYTIAQDEESCVVFGMPRVAIARGGVQLTVSLSKISGVVLGNLMKSR